jgi:hypothetical protein
MWNGVTVALVLAVVAVVAGAADAHGPRTAVPPDVRRILDQQFAGWRFATIIHSLKAQLEADASPEWTAGDYDGDGQPDYAVQIVRRGVMDEPQVVLAFLRRGARYDVHTLMSIPIQEGAYLRTSPKGQVLMDVDKGTKFTAATDVVEVLYGQEAGEAFIYEQGRFRRIVSGD